MKEQEPKSKNIYEAMSNDELREFICQLEAELIVVKREYIRRFGPKEYKIEPWAGHTE